MARIARALCGVAAWLLLGGPVGAGEIQLSPDVVGPYTLRITSLREARHLTTLQQKYDFSCGSAAVATLLTHHYDTPVNEQTVFRTMYQHGDQRKIRREGFSLLDMKRYLASRGFEADGFEAPLDALVQAAVPAIVLINERGYNHFVVIKGVRDGRVVFGDPAAGTRVMARRDFEAMWLEGILFVVRNHQETARFNRMVDWRVVPKAPVEEVLRGPLDAMRMVRSAGDF